ncbi:MAG TPA: aspartate-semialdehyde dehydrogenase [Fibrobacteria bacterium]|nr:aspartate-semialdehyde dehydrogenase [Fibrobacteria bacterium]
MSVRVAIMGATGAVGAELLSLLDERKFPIGELRLLASKRSAGTTLEFQGRKLKVEELIHGSFEGIDLVLASAGGSISAEFAPSAVKAGAVVVDNTSKFRMVDGVPLVIPEINADRIKDHKGIIANPNCSTIIMALPVYPLHKAFGIKRVHAATYQAASGAGARAMEELKQETAAVLEGREFKPTVIPHPYAFNVFPHNAPWVADVGYNEEELKMVNETAKIFETDSVKVHATCVRVPVLRAHSEALNVEFEREVTVEEAMAVLAKAPGVRILEDAASNRWPMPLDASGKDPVLVGRMRKDRSQPNTLDFWVVGDQIRKGAALNAVQIAEHLFA